MSDPSVPSAHPALTVGRQFLWYAVIGVFTTALYYGIWWVLFEAGVDYRVASAIGYGVGSLVNFGLQKWLTFRDRSNSAVGWQLLAYWIIVGVSLGLTVAGVWLGVALAGLEEWLSVIVTSAVILVFNFAAHKWITFNRSVFPAA
jgi:putative flippase GtrA